MSLGQYLELKSTYYEKMSVLNFMNMIMYRLGYFEINVSNVVLPYST